MGRSDKPTDVTDYSYLGHIDRLQRFIEELGLRNIAPFVQDWGSLIGLHVIGDNPDWFARVVVGDGALPVVPEDAGNIECDSMRWLTIGLRGAGKTREP